MTRIIYPLGGWLAPGTPVRWDHSDHGEDIVIGGNHVIQSPGEGVCTAVLSDAAFPNGFGPKYPQLLITSGPWKDFRASLGHTTSLVSAGQHFGFGHPVAVANQSGAVPGWPAGWCEFGTSSGSSPDHINPPHWYKDKLLADYVVNQPDPPLHRGDFGFKVLLFSDRLHTIGDLPRRYWNFTTDVAGGVIQFQKRHRIAPPNGIVNGSTWVAIHHSADVVHQTGKKEV